MTHVDDDEGATKAGQDATLPDATEADPPETAAAAVPPRLESLTSRYDERQHATYLRHLENAVADTRNRNIALSGRYGAGKSSVLDKFEELHGQTTLRIAISTLGPDAEGAQLTNRIQKELVKQLLYRTALRNVRFSRFTRITPLTRTRAAIEAVAAVVVIGLILAFLGWLPPVAGTGVGHSGLLRVLSWLGFSALAATVLTAVRLVVHGRTVSDISAAGATIKLTRETSTYFDEYLEEIVYFFDEKSPDIVIFEDLDRFDDPHIFEALRELNTLLNHTPKRIKKGTPLRFVYAIKDSLFERLGTDTEPAPLDDATVETIRANRTKFFDVVIPVVPFISHRNARDLLAGLLQASGDNPVDRDLIALVARHATDMRLLKNICNEYRVFAERLLKPGASAPGLTPTRIFALIAYKNFHFKDFEEISRRSSRLDVLYDQRHELVRANIEDVERRRRDLLDEPEKAASSRASTARLTGRLIAAGSIPKNRTVHSGWAFMQFHAGDRWYNQDEVNSVEFWTAAAQAAQIQVMATTDLPGLQKAGVGALDRSQIQGLFPEAADANQWAEADDRHNEEELRKLRDDIEFLRGADFQHLAAKPRFTLPTADGKRSFAEIIDENLTSQLARDLVKGGHIDRNFTLYATQFYGDYTGVDVATYLVQHVQTNKPDFHYPFSGPDAVANLLREAPQDFTGTIGAYNIDVLDYLLQHQDPRAADIARTVASDFGHDAQKFLTAYLNDGEEPALFTGLLSKHPWLPVFSYLVENDAVPALLRPALVDSALREHQEDQPYELNPSVRDFIEDHYLLMSTFTSSQDRDLVNKVIKFIGALDVLFPALEELDENFRNRVVRQRLYRITADNLRMALGSTGDISLDRIREHGSVYTYCQLNPSAYLEAAQADPGTPYSVRTADALSGFLANLPAAWEEHIEQFLSMAAHESRLEQLESVPQAHWPAMAAHHLFHPTVRNIRAYIDAAGSVDQALADLIVSAGCIDGVDDQAEALQVAIDVLNATDTIPDAARRVDLASRLGLEDWVPAAKLEPEGGTYLSLLIEHHLVDDSHDSFMHFRSTGWTAIEAGIRASSEFANFMTPELVSGFVIELLNSPATPQKARDQVIDNLAEYVPTDDPAALRAAGRYALSRGRQVPAQQLKRIAAAAREDVTFVLRLLATGSTMPPAADVIAVLNELGEPYSHLYTGASQSFEVPDDPAHQQVFTYLKKEGQISDFAKRRRRSQPHRLVTIA